MLKTYNIDLPKSVPMSSSASTVDDISVSIVKRYHPVILESHVPIEVCGDGNCLFRAVSKGLRNTEEHHMQIRLLTLLELILNRSHLIMNMKPLLTILMMTVLYLTVLTLF
ncbi:hypothetical protein PoB_000968500 [Plakobranchus ocellatus]|uniref:OTU domain-containing protein n=1 Tax=Plakobranchus ocellatus TaxID=259542 RepID=A0AAV3YJA9_9GAST|nr:hypothetical protein PoB_000968500 [Plakobranchus ocellatus]